MTSFPQKRTKGIGSCSLLIFFMSSKESDNLEAPWHVMQITWRNSEKIIFAQ
jgi:hypothetical protein